ncbi:iron complex transport system substrate-binding protein [Brevundimonas alba]|uniref:Iron complex transport system substrate-binding protein n=1 Tax=Brevundimonas alba TaxID=74314 RepID=A0A7X6BNB2_9CAUL|nr:iron ABC transporter substrate-binding protein [Brevundimonas alba]NJC41242.1 iron complex transport system substrate-binding protein [Brevundimonas alba]
MLTRRALTLSGLAGGLLAAGCSGPPTAAAGDVVAAGQPAALLIWAVARNRLAGWPRKPDMAALAALPGLAAALPELGALASGGRPATPEAIAALKPRLVIDYGDADPEHQGLATRMKARLGVDWRLIDGSLPRMPEAFHEAGQLLDSRSRGEELADAAADILERWRRAPAGRTFYYARGADGLETGFRGALATEVLEGARWTNVAEGSRDIGRVTREQVAAWDPEVIVTLSPEFAAAAADDPVWRNRRNGARRTLLLLPTTPFGWIDRPPSVNRLLGCAWLANPEHGWMELTVLSRRLYGMAPAEIPRPRWIR